MAINISAEPRKRSESNIGIKKTKISDSDFCVLNYSEFKEMNKINYNVKQLKDMCKYYKLKISGKAKI